MSDEILTDAEIIDFHESIGADFGSTTAVQVVRQGVLKVACGWFNGSTCNEILKHHGLIKIRHNEEPLLTRKGKRYLWECFKDDSL